MLDDWQNYFEPTTLAEHIPMISGYVVLTVFLSAVFFCNGCTKPDRTTIPTYEQAKATALKEAPFVEPKIEDRYKLKCDDKPVVMKKDPTSGVPHTGLLITNDKAECIAAQKAERDRVRIELEAERLRSRTRQIINDAAYKRMAEESRTTWWERNGGGVLFATGAAVGMAIVIGVMYALTGGKSINSSSTQLHVIPVR